MNGGTEPAGLSIDLVLNYHVGLSALSQDVGGSPLEAGSGSCLVRSRGSGGFGRDEANLPVGVHFRGALR